MDRASPEQARLESELRRDLAAGERVLWQAMPDPKRLGIGFVIWIFAVPWTAFALAWTGIALTVYLSAFGQSDIPSAPWWGWVFPLFGTPFIAVGLWMLWKPFAAIADARHTLHALTDRRLISLTHRRSRKVKSVPLDRLGPVTLKERAGSKGDLSVETGSHRDSEGDRVTDRFDFTGVPDVARLHRLLIEAQRPT